MTVASSRGQEYERLLVSKGLKMEKCEKKKNMSSRYPACTFDGSQVSVSGSLALVRRLLGPIYVSITLGTK